MEKKFEIEKMINEKEAVICVKGWLDTQTAPKLQEAIETLGEEITSLKLDFAELEYISSAGIRQLVAAHKKMSGKDGFTLIHVPNAVMDILKITGLHKRLNIEE